MRHRFLAVGSAFLAVLFTGCSAVGPVAVEDYLRAPQFSGQYSQVQKALNSYLGESAQLKYPTGGEYLSPFLFGDWDGDGHEDAAVLYTSPAKGQNVQIAILEQNHNGEWQVTQEKEGLSTEVESVCMATMEGKTGTQLVVGYGTTQGDQYLTVYSYSNVTLNALLETAYSEYLLADITGNGSQDLVVVMPGEQGIQLELLTNLDGSYQVLQTLELSQGRFLGCAGLYSSIGQWNRHYLVVDGYTGSNGSYLASEILYYDGTLRQLAPYVSSSEVDLYGATLRYGSNLFSRDIIGSGTVEIPTELSAGEGGAISPKLEKRLSYVAWNDYTYPNPEKCFGVVDAEYGYFVMLPQSWKGEISLTEGDTDNYWEVRSLDGGQLYLSIRIVNLGAPNRQDYLRVALLGSQQIQIKATDTARENGFSIANDVIVVL